MLFPEIVGWEHTDEGEYANKLSLLEISVLHLHIAKAKHSEAWAVFIATWIIGSQRASEWNQADWSLLDVRMIFQNIDVSLCKKCLPLYIKNWSQK